MPRTTIKKFLIQFESSEDTRWLYSDKEFARIINEVCQPAASYLTTGPKPAIKVILDERHGD